MKKFRSNILIAIFLLFISQSIAIFAQSKSQEYSEEDGIPVLTKHLPDYENVVNSATYILNSDDLRKSLGDHPVLDSIDFAGGTEAVSAKYPAGTLLIVEFTTPQFSAEADRKVNQKLAEISGDRPVYYRRIGNYNVFVFDSPDESSANSLIDQVEYEKDIRWLGRDPFALQRAERTFVLQASDLFTNIVVGIVGALSLSVFAGIIVGFIFYFVRQQQRAKMEAFSDAGGMTRLNLDGFTPEIFPERLLDK